MELCHHDSATKGRDEEDQTATGRYGLNGNGKTRADGNRNTAMGKIRAEQQRKDMGPQQQEHGSKNRMNTRCYQRLQRWWMMNDDRNDGKAFPVDAPKNVAEKAVTSFSWATLWQTPHWIVFKHKYNNSQKGTKDGFRFERPKTHESKVSARGSTKRNKLKNDERRDWPTGSAAVARLANTRRISWAFTIRGRET